MEENSLADDVATAIARIYAGEPGGFVSRRDSLARELRVAGKRDEAAMVKRLRKPTRLAWALDMAAFVSPEGIERVTAAVSATLVVQAGGGDLRAALAELREVVQQFADTASAAAAQTGHPADPSELVNAVMAVIGVTGALETLRAGRLVDIPEGGGIDFLTGLTPSAGTPAPAGVDAPLDRTVQVDGSQNVMRRIEIALAAARERSSTAERALRDAEAAVESAERMLQLAQQEALARKAERDRARKAAREAAAGLASAERAMTRAMSRASEA